MEKVARGGAKVSLHIKRIWDLNQRRSSGLQGVVLYTVLERSSPECGASYESFKVSIVYECEGGFLFYIGCVNFLVI